MKRSKEKRERERSNIIDYKSWICSEMSTIPRLLRSIHSFIHFINVTDFLSMFSSTYIVDFVQRDKKKLEKNSFSCPNVTFLVHVIILCLFHCDLNAQWFERVNIFHICMTNAINVWRKNICQYITIHSIQIMENRYFSSFSGENIFTFRSHMFSSTEFERHSIVFNKSRATSSVDRHSNKYFKIASDFPCAKTKNE